MKKILFILLGVGFGILITLGVIKYFRIQLFPVSILEAQIDISEKCGTLKKVSYCYSGELCEMQCNLCNCDVPYCQLDAKMCSQSIP